MGAKFAVAQKMLVIGGCELALEKNPYSSIEVIDLKEQKHFKFPYELAIPARGGQTLLYNSKLYHFGGCKGQKQHLSEVQTLDLKDEQVAKSLSGIDSESQLQMKHWSIETFKMIRERSCFMMTLVGSSQAYIFGGFNGYECLREVERVDLSQDEAKFEEMKPMTHPVKNGVSYFNKEDGLIYIIGGWDEKDTQDKVFTYDPTLGDMNFFCFLPHKVEGHTVEVVRLNSLGKQKSVMYIFGGFDGLGVTDRIIRLDLESRKASVVLSARLSYKRENHTSQLIGEDLIVVAGGWDGSRALSSVEIFQYSPESDSLTKLIHEDTHQDLFSIRNRPCSVLI